MDILYAIVIYCTISVMVFILFETEILGFENIETRKEAKKKLNGLKIFYSIFWILIPFVWFLIAVEDEKQK